jgi:hypothetical protein
VTTRANLDQLTAAMVQMRPEAERLITGAHLLPKATRNRITHHLARGLISMIDITERTHAHALTLA